MEANRCRVPQAGVETIDKEMSVLAGTERDPKTNWRSREVEMGYIGTKVLRTTFAFLAWPYRPGQVYVKAGRPSSFEYCTLHDPMV